jgi:hypothetical protein
MNNPIILKRILTPRGVEVQTPQSASPIKVCKQELHTVQHFHSPPPSLDIPPQIAVHKQWCYIGVWLYLYFNHSSFCRKGNVKPWSLVAPTYCSGNSVLFRNFPRHHLSRLRWMPSLVTFSSYSQDAFCCVGLPIDIKFRTNIEGVNIGIDRLLYDLWKTLNCTSLWRTSAVNIFSIVQITDSRTCKR